MYKQRVKKYKYLKLAPLYFSTLKPACSKDEGAEKKRKFMTELRRVRARRVHESKVMLRRRARGGNAVKRMAM